MKRNTHNEKITVENPLLSLISDCLAHEMVTIIKDCSVVPAYSGLEVA
jgi:hypothetical protein